MIPYGFSFRSILSALYFLSSLGKKTKKLSYEFLEISKVMLLAAYLQLYRRKSMHVWFSVIDSNIILKWKKKIPF